MVSKVSYCLLYTSESLASLEGFYYKPRVDRELLEQYHGGLIALSGCLAGEVAQKILQDDLDGARETAQWYRDTFGAENYYFEVQNHGIHEQMQVNYHLDILSRELDIPLVATNDNHYVYAEDVYKRQGPGGTEIVPRYSAGYRACHQRWFLL